MLLKVYLSSLYSKNQIFPYCQHRFESFLISLNRFKWKLTRWTSRNYCSVENTSSGWAITWKRFGFVNFLPVSWPKQWRFHFSFQSSNLKHHIIYIGLRLPIWTMFVKNVPNTKFHRMSALAHAIKNKLLLVIKCFKVITIYNWTLCCSEYSGFFD